MYARSGSPAATHAANRLVELAVGRTTLVIAHALTTIDHTDHVALSSEAFKRIAAATWKVERTYTNMTGDRTPSHGTSPGFWAMILGMDISGRKYSFNKVIFDPTSTRPEPFAIHDTVQSPSTAT